MLYSSILLKYLLCVVDQCILFWFLRTVFFVSQEILRVQYPLGHANNTCTRLAHGIRLKRFYRLSIFTRSCIPHISVDLLTYFTSVFICHEIFHQNCHHSVVVTTSQVSTHIIKSVFANDILN